LKLLLFFILLKIFDFLCLGGIVQQEYSTRETPCSFEQAKYSGNESIIKTNQPTVFSPHFVKTVFQNSEGYSEERMLALPSKGLFAGQEFLKVVNINLLVPLIHAP